MKASNKQRKSNRWKHRIENQKDALERAAIQCLLGCKAFKGYVFCNMQDRPDAIIQDINGNKIGVEICHPFYDKQEAKLLLGRGLGFVGLQSSTGVIKRLNEEIAKKIEKFGNYSKEYPIILLLRLPAESLLQIDFINSPDHELKIPPNNYKGIYILMADPNCQERSWTQLFKAYSS